MPFAYDWLTKQQKTHILQIFIYTYDEKIIILLTCRGEGDIPGISYERNGRFTLVTFEHNELVVPLHFSDVFREDLKMLLINQKTVLECLGVSSKGTGISAAKCFLSLDEILKATTPVFAVKEVNFTDITVSQAMSMIRFLNSYELLDVIFSLPGDAVSFEELSNGFRNLEEGYKFDLKVQAKTIGKNDLIAINKLYSFSEIIHNLEIFSEFLQDKDECNAILSDNFIFYESLQDEDECNAILSDNFILTNGFTIRWTIKFKRKTPKLWLKTPPKEKTPINTDSCEKTSRSVLQNPVLAELISESLECFDIQRLRKVSRDIRKCIDIVKPNPGIEKYSIYFKFSVHENEVYAHVDLGSGDFKHIGYWRDEFLRGMNEYNVYDHNFPEDLCLLDFEVNLRHQKSCLEELSIVYECFKIRAHTLGFAQVSYEEFSKKIGDIIKRREHPLKTQKFSMGCRNQMEIMEVLPAIDRNFLKVIELLHPFEQGYIGHSGIEELPIEVDELSQTDQWRNAEQLISKYSIITTPIELMNILHFSNVEILVKTLSSQDVNYLKTNLLKSSKFQKFKISFWQSAIDESIHQLIGEPYRNFSNLKKVWYFRIENTDYYIHIVLDTRDVKNEEGILKHKVIVFTRVAKEDTPFFELPINQLAIN